MAERNEAEAIGFLTEKFVNIELRKTDNYAIVTFKLSLTFLVLFRLKSHKNVFGQVVDTRRFLFRFFHDISPLYSHMYI